MLKKRINNLYSTIHSSPVKSSINVATFEESIVGRVDDLENLVEKQESEKANEILTEIERLINKRNLTLKAEQ